MRRICTHLLWPATASTLKSSLPVRGLLLLLLLLAAACAFKLSSTTCIN
jgi:hypothetical protein